MRDVLSYHTKNPGGDKKIDDQTNRIGYRGDQQAACHRWVQSKSTQQKGQTTAKKSRI
jgi:hypothetical protein